MRLEVECCGATARAAGAQRLSVTLQDGATVRELFAHLSKGNAELAGLLECCACARGDTIVSRATVLADGDELALLPPVAGG